MPSKKQKQTYERDQIIYIGFREPFHGLEFDGEGQITKVHLDGGRTAKPDAVFSSIEYVRASGKRKVVSSIPGIAGLNELEILQRNFDVIVVVDTNTLSINGEPYSVACFAAGLTKSLGVVQNSNGRLTAKTNIKRAGFICFKNCDHPGTAEKFSLWKVVSMLSKSPNFGKHRYGVVTDHDLSKHGKWNAGEIPLFGVFTLPSNVTLLYATTDAGSNTFLAALLSVSDKEATRMLKDLRDKGQIDIGGKPLPLAGIKEYSEIATMP